MFCINKGLGGNAWSPFSMTPKVGFAAILPPFSLHRIFYGLVQSFLKGESFLLLESGST